jgi:hypothetical protein
VKLTRSATLLRGHGSWEPDAPFVSPERVNLFDSSAAAIPTHGSAGAMGNWRGVEEVQRGAQGSRAAGHLAVVEPVRLDQLAGWAGQV